MNKLQEAREHLSHAKEMKEKTEVELIALDNRRWPNKDKKRELLETRLKVYDAVIKKFQSIAESKYGSQF